jgi:hypothetical protein
MAGHGEDPCELTPKRRAASGQQSNWLTVWAVGRYDLGLSELEFWDLSFTEYNALIERDLEHQDMLEYCAALAPWAVFNVNRGKDAEFMQPLDFMLRRRARVAMRDETETETTAPAVPRPQQGTPAHLVAPVPPGGRYALPGERPPSKYKPGQNDNVIERFDAYAAAFWSGKVRRNGR